jgi:hypothetical protein
MFDSSQIKDLGLVGWRASTVSGVPTLTAPNTDTSSGMVYQDFSSLVTVQNVWKVQEDAAISDANFNAFLTNLTNAAFVKVLNAVFQEQDYIENRVLFPYENTWTETIDNDTSFVGFEINPANRRDLLIALNSVFTSFDSADTVKLLLFHSSKNAPIESKEISVAELTDTDTSLSWDLSNFTYSGGKFYIGYLRSGLTAKAINREWNSANVQSCFNMFQIQPITVTGWDSETLFDVDDVDYESDTYGLNFDITSWKDYTNIILRNKNKFVNALGLQVAADVLDLILKSTSSNRIERELGSAAFTELEGFINENLPRTVGISKKLINEIARIRKTFVEVSPIRRGTL